jgi:hypothetical protein
MARYQATMDTPCPPAQVFAYLSDFTTAAEWDPGTVQSERLGDGPIGEGTDFRLVAVSRGPKTTLTYRIVEYQPTPSRSAARTRPSSHSTGSPSNPQTAERGSSTTPT